MAVGDPERFVARPRATSLTGWIAVPAKVGLSGSDVGLEHGQWMSSEQSVLEP